MLRHTADAIHEQADATTRTFNAAQTRWNRMTFPRDKHRIVERPTLIYTRSNMEGVELETIVVVRLSLMVISGNTAQIPICAREGNACAKPKGPSQGVHQGNRPPLLSPPHDTLNAGQELNFGNKESETSDEGWREGRPTEADAVNDSK